MKYTIVLSLLAINAISCAAEGGERPQEKGQLTPCPYTLPVNKAIYRGERVMLRKLIEEYGQDCSSLDHRNHTPLHVALLHSADEDVPTYLLNQNIHWEAQDDDGNTVAHLAVITKKSNAFLQTLLAPGKVAVNVRNNEGLTALDKAFALGADGEDAARILIKSGACSRQDKEGMFPIFRALKTRDRAFFDLIIRLKAIGNEHDKFNRNPLHIALFYAEEDVIHALMDNTPPAIHFEAQQDVDGRTPLHTAMMLSKHTPKLLNTLIARTRLCGTIPAYIKDGRAPLDWYDNDGNAPIHTAVFHGFLAGITALLNGGVSVESVNREHKTPLLLTLEPIGHPGSPGYGALITALVKWSGNGKSGADVCRKDADGNTPLHAATAANNAEAIKYLLLNGAVKAIKNNAGKTAYETLGIEEPLPTDTEEVKVAKELRAKQLKLNHKWIIAALKNH